jgi:hypothetical protein
MLTEDKLALAMPSTKKCGNHAINILRGLEGEQALLSPPEQATAIALVFVALCRKLGAMPRMMVEYASNMLDRGGDHHTEIRALNMYMEKEVVQKR